MFAFWCNDARRAGLLAAMAIVCLTAHPLVGEERAPGIANATSAFAGTHLVVLRLSDSVLNSLVARKIDREVPVSDVILGTTLVGRARIVGEPSVTLKPSSGDAKFDVIVRGTILSRTVGRNGPATIYAHSVTYFTASEQVVFEPGQGFRGGGITVDAQTQCTIDDVQVNRGGLIGRIAQRRAWGEVQARHTEASAIAAQHSRARIVAIFDKFMGERLARLNRSTDVRAALAELRADPNGKTIYSCSSTPHYVEIATLEVPAELNSGTPAASRVAKAGSPIEVWIHKSLVGDNVAEALEKLTTDPTNSEILQALAIAPGVIGKETLAALTAALGEGKVACRSAGNWFVVQINPTPANVAGRTSVAQPRYR